MCHTRDYPKVLEGFSQVSKEGETKLKEYRCIQVGNHRDIADAIEEYQNRGWLLHTYQASSRGTFPEVLHYLLFERESS